MPRTYTRTSDKQMDRTNLEKAFYHRVNTGCTIHKAAMEFGVKKTTLMDALNRSKEHSDGVTFVPVSRPAKMVFTRQQELQIVDYAIHAAKMYYGLPMTELRRMVYLYAVAVGSTAIPSGWEMDKTASRDWCYGFMRRHPNLALKVPKAISIARIGAFNKVTVKAFFDAYTLAMEKYQFTPDRIYNVDETVLSTVMKPIKVVCGKDQPVAWQVSGERGETMTFVGIINAVGVALPPVLIIPRVRWNPTFMRNTTYGTKGILQPSGWMTGETFVETLKHIQENSSCSPQNKILLLMDNAECHRNLSIVEFALRNGIVITTLPLHTTDKLQPLDVSVFGPFKAILHSRLNDYQHMHPNEDLTVHHLPEFAADAWTRGATPSNILSGFRSTGIWPIDRNIFPDEAFLGAQITERSAPPENFDVEVGPSSSDEALSSNEEVGQRHTDSHASPATPDGPGPSSAPGHVSPPPVVLGEPGSSTDPATPVTPPTTSPPTTSPPTSTPSTTPSTSTPSTTPSTTTPSTTTPPTTAPSTTTPSTTTPSTTTPSTTRCHKWWMNTGRSDLDFKKHHRQILQLTLCKDHFTKEHFMCPADKGAAKKRKNLRKDAVPTLSDIPNTPMESRLQRELKRLKCTEDTLPLQRTRVPTVPNNYTIRTPRKVFIVEGQTTIKKEEEEDVGTNGFTTGPNVNENQEVWLKTKEECLVTDNEGDGNEGFGLREKHYGGVSERGDVCR